MMKHPEKPPVVSSLSNMPTEKLLAFIKDEQTNKALQEVEADYLYWETFKRKVKTLPYEPEFLWGFIKLFNRNKSVTNVSLLNTEEFSFKFNTPVKVLKYLHKFDMYIGGMLEGRSIIPQDDKNRYLISSIMEEAIASSQLEGAATTREIAKEMLRSKRKPKTTDERMILNNYLTIKKVIKEKDTPLTKELLLELHSLVTNGTLDDHIYEGKFRDNDRINVIDPITGEIYYMPPSHTKIETVMDKFIEFANHDDPNEFIHPIIKGIILHFLIGYIHPFVDGNGRTARAVFYWYLISKGYWLVEYMSISKVIIRASAQYARAYLYSENDQNDLTYFIDYNLKCLNLALESLQQYISRKVIEKENLFYLIKNANVNERQADLLKNLIVDNKKSFTIKEIQNKFAIAYQTARTDLYGLLELGYLKERKFGKKLVFFKSDDFQEKIEHAARH